MNLQKNPIVEQSFKENINEILDKTTIQKYYAGVLKWSKNKKALPLDFVALCVLFGELVRQENGGQWVLLKRYGVFNPYFIPSILANHKVIDHLSGRVMGMLQRNLKESSILFLSPMVGIDVQFYTNASAQVIYLK